MKLELVSVTKEATFDCAHMLSGYNGKCKNLHGHTYKIAVTVTSVTEPSTHMVVDFNGLKAAIDTIVMEQFDHAIVFSMADLQTEAECALQTWASNYGMHYVVLPCRSTCEDMSVYFAKKFRYMYPNAARIKIKLWETPTSSAEAEA